MKVNKYLACLTFCLMTVIIFCKAFRDIPVDKEDLRGWDFRLFQGTKAWELAKAVEDENVEGIKFQVNNIGVPVDYREERFKQTLLMLAVCTNKYESVKTLLELGADPNTPNDTIHDFGDNAVTLASEYPETSPKILKLLLEHGGNPNSVCRGKKQDNLGEWVPMRFFALYNAVPIDGDFEKVRILVEAGADVNLQTEDTGAGAIGVAIAINRMDVLLYLLEHGGDYHKKFERQDFSSPSPSSPFYVDILYMLRLCAFPLNSREYKFKMKVVNFLESKGLDYKSSEIPNKGSDDAIEIIKKKINPKNKKELKEYIQKY